MNTELTNRPSFLTSKETEAAQALLSKASIGDVITWEQLSAAMQCNAQDHRACVETARKTLITESQMIFGSVRSIGLKRLNDSEVVTQEQATPAKVRRKVKASMRRLATVNPAELPEADRQQYTFTSSALGAIALCVKPSSLAKVQQSTLTNGKLDPVKTLELFK